MHAAAAKAADLRRSAPPQLETKPRTRPLLSGILGAVEGQFEGVFETHITVSCEDGGSTSVARLDAWARPSGMKVTHVVLARGRVCSQPMLTLTGSGTLAAQLAKASGVAAEAEAAGFPVVRVKVEATPWTRGVPQNAAEARELGPERYFEHHVKILCEGGHAGLEDLAARVVPHVAHLSWNARRVRSDGRAERFVTQRCALVGDPDAQRALDALCATLAHDGREIVSVEREFVVYDSDSSLDAGWIDMVKGGRRSERGFERRAVGLSGRGPGRAAGAGAAEGDLAL